MPPSVVKYQMVLPASAGAVLRALGSTLESTEGLVPMQIQIQFGLGRSRRFCVPNELPGGWSETYSWSSRGLEHFVFP